MATSADLLPLRSVLVSCLSTDNTERSTAEAALNEQWALQQPDALLQGLTRLIREDEDPSIRSLAAVLFRRTALRAPQSPSSSAAAASNPDPTANATEDADESRPAPWDVVGEATRQGCKHLLIEALQAETVDSVRRKISDTVADLYKYGSAKAQPWPQLQPTLAALTSSPDTPPHRDCAFRLIAAAPALLARQPTDSIRSLFTTHLEDPSLPVRVTVLRALVAFLCEADVRVRNGLVSVIARLPDLLISLANAADEDSLHDALNAMIELAESLPKLLRGPLAPLTAFCVQCMSAPSLEDQTRQSALEVLITTAENAPGMVRKDTGFVPAVIPLLLQWAATIEDDADWYTTDDLDGDDNEALYIVAEQSLDRLSRALGGKTTLPTAFAFIHNMIQAPAPDAWPQRYAALIAISAIAEGCAKMMEKELASIVHLVVPLFSDPSPRVRWAACNCLGQMSTDFAGPMQERFHAEVLGQLIPTLQDDQFPRVQAHAAAALVNFCEEADKDTLAPYMDALFSGLIHLLSNPRTYVQEQAITTIATIADSAGDRFSQYYSTIMPLLFTILEQTAGHRDLRSLRGKAMECATLIALAVGKDTVAPQLDQLIRFLCDTQASITEADDPQISYLLAAWARLCTLLGDAFTPYLDTVLPPLLRSARLSPNFVVLEGDEDPEAAYSAEDGWEFIPVDGQQIGIRTTVLEEKCTAIEMIGCYAAELKGSLGPYIPDVLDIVLPLLKFYFHEGVRHAAAVTLPALLEGVKSYDPSALASTWDTMSQRINDAIINDADASFLTQLLSTYSECLGVIAAPPASLTPPQIDDFARVIESQLLEFYQRHRARIDQAARGAEEGPEGEGEEDAEILQEEQDTDDVLLAEMNRACQTLLKAAGEAFLPSFDERLLAILRTFLADPAISVRQFALMFIDDIIEYTGPASGRYVEVFGAPLIKALSDPEPDARQAAAYGIGLAALLGGPAWADVSLTSIPPLLQIISAPGARDEGVVYVSENAVSALTKIFKSGTAAALPASDAEAALAAWFAALPLTHDEEEAPLTYTLLTELLDANNPVILRDGANVPHLLAVLVRALGADILPAEQSAHLATYLRSLIAQAPQDVWMPIWSALDVTEQTIIQAKGYLG